VKGRGAILKVTDIPSGESVKSSESSGSIRPIAAVVSRNGLGVKNLLRLECQDRFADAGTVDRCLLDRCRGCAFFRGGISALGDGDASL
jgi:hypothetical protein